jgi:hypothetical protein
MLLLNIKGGSMIFKQAGIPISICTFILSSFLVVSCGFGGGNKGSSPSSNLNPSTADIYDPAGQHLKTNRLPSQLKQGTDLPICQTGETYALDQCWQKLIINADDASISVEKTDGTSQRLFKFNGKINQSLEKFYTLKIASSHYNETCDPNTSMYGQCYDIYANPGSARQYFQIPYQAGSGITVPRVSFRSISGEWSTSSLPENTPWVTSNEITLDKSSTSTTSFGVKTTFAYGLVADTSNQNNLYKVAHYWDLKGKLIVNSKSYSFPLQFSDLEKDMALENIGTPTGYMDSKKIQIGDICLIFYPEKNTKYSYLDFIKSENKNTDKIKGIVITASWDNQNF